MIHGTETPNEGVIYAQTVDVSSLINFVAMPNQLRLLRPTNAEKIK